MGLLPDSGFRQCSARRGMVVGSLFAEPSGFLAGSHCGAEIWCYLMTAADGPLQIVLKFLKCDLDSDSRLVGVDNSWIGLPNIKRTRGESSQYISLVQNLVGKTSVLKHLKYHCSRSQTTSTISTNRRNRKDSRTLINSHQSR